MNSNLPFEIVNGLPLCVFLLLKTRISLKISRKLRSKKPRVRASCTLRGCAAECKTSTLIHQEPCFMSILGHAGRPESISSKERLPQQLCETFPPSETMSSTGKFFTSLVAQQHVLKAVHHALAFGIVARQAYKGEGGCTHRRWHHKSCSVPQVTELGVGRRLLWWWPTAWHSRQQPERLLTPQPGCPDGPGGQRPKMTSMLCLCSRKVPARKPSLTLRRHATDACLHQSVQGHHSHPPQRQQGGLMWTGLGCQAR